MRAPRPTSSGSRRIVWSSSAGGSSSDERPRRDRWDARPLGDIAPTAVARKRPPPRLGCLFTRRASPLSLASWNFRRNSVRRTVAPLLLEDQSGARAFALVVREATGGARAW